LLQEIRESRGMEAAIWEGIVNLRTTQQAFESRRNRPLAGLSAVPPAAAASAELSLCTSRALLLRLYAIVPLSLAVMLVDVLFLGGWIRRSLPSTPENLLLFSLFFNLPHILASSLTFLDPDYATRYGKRLSTAAFGFAALFLIFPGLINIPAFSGAVYFWTVVHIVGQQFGMLRLMGRIPESEHRAWRWSGFALATLIYVGTVADEMIPAGAERFVRVGSWLAFPVFLYFSLKLIRSVDTARARSYASANVAMMATILAASSLGFSFFVVLIPRVLHDLSAFVFYVSHDVNRNRPEPRNLAHRALAFTRLPSWAIGPFLALAAAAPLTIHADESWAIRIALALTLFHYFTDGFAWRSGSPHRESIRIA